MRQDTSFSPGRPRADIPQALADHERLVHWVLHRQWLGPLPYAEALQVGRIALWRALQGYDPTRGYALSTYAVPAMARAIWRAVSQAQPHPLEVLTPHPPQAAPDLDDLAEELEVRQALYRLVARLPQPLQQVIVAHYGLAGQESQSFTLIGQALGLTRQRVQQLHVQALLWLAHPAHSLALRQRLGCNTIAHYRAFLARRRVWLRARRRSP